MMNFLSKSLVLLHATMCLMGMAWAMAIVLQARDYGWVSPEKEVLEYNADGTPKTAVLYASEYDKSVAALREADKTRNITYAHVKPAIAAARATEPYLPNNHLVYLVELRRLRESPDPIEVRHLKDFGAKLDTGNDLGKPVADDPPVANIVKSRKLYEADLRQLLGSTDPVTKKVTPGELDVLESQIRKITEDTKRVTAQLTGTDEANKYIQPGLYQLIDLEFEHQKAIKRETEDIKPNHSKAVEQARLHQFRRADLEATLKKLLAAPLPSPPAKKKL